MKKLVITSFVLFISLVSAMAVEPGYEALPFLRISRDPSALTGGSAQLISSSSAYSVFSNPTLPAFSDDNLHVGLSYAKWAPNAANDIDFGASYRISQKFGVSIGLSYALQEPYDIVNSLGNVSGSFTPSDMIVGAGVFFRFNDVLALGANVKYATSKVTNNNSYGAVAGDVFVTAGFGGFMASLGVSSLGSSIKDSKGETFSLPASAALAVGYSASLGEVVQASAQLTGDYYFSGALAAGAGAEISIKDMVALRFGYNYGGQSVIPSYASVGAGFTFKGICLNASYLLGSSAVGGTLCVGIGCKF